MEDFRENSIQQRRSLKSLGKRREDEQEQISECSRFVQNSNRNQKRNESELAIIDTVSTSEGSWKDYNQEQSSTENSEIESYK